MKIKEFFENYRHCHNIFVFIYDENNRLKGGWDIYTSKDFDNFINDYGDEDFKKWSVENNEYDTEFTFYLK